MKRKTLIASALILISVFLLPAGKAYAADIAVSFSSATSVIDSGSSVPVSIVMKNNGTAERKVNVAQVKVTFDQSKVAVNVATNPCLDLPVRSEYSTGSGYFQLACGVSGSTFIIIPAGGSKNIASFDLSALSGASGSTVLSFSYSQVMEYPSSGVISDNGSPKTYSFGASATTAPQKPIAVTLSSPSYSLIQGGTPTNVDIMMENQSASTLVINAGGVKISFDPTRLSLSSQSNPCGTDLPILKQNILDGNTIEISCSTNGGETVSFAPGTRKKIASFSVAAKSGAPMGNTVLSFLLVQVPEVPSLEPLSDQGTPRTYTIMEQHITPNISATPTATPPSGRDKYVIDIGNKQQLNINISGPSVTPSVTGTEPVPTLDPDIPLLGFAVKLAGTEDTGSFPEVKMRLTLDDMTKQLGAPSGTNGDGCSLPGWGETFYSDIVMIADSNKVFRPKPGSQFKVGSNTYSVTSAGQIPLYHVELSNIYKLSVKGPKHRNMQMEERVRFAKASVNTYDWTSRQLEPGDLHHPDHGLVQDCVVNMTDLSLIQSRLGKNTDADLFIADVDYNGAVNANDISSVLVTMQTKPDDD